MWKAIFAGTTALTIAGATLAIAQQVPDRDSSQRWRPSAEDRSALTDAQLAELKAGLRLTPSQEKYWPNFEAVLRERAKQRAAEQKRLADVLEPLYNSLDESQQQQFAMLFRAEGERRSTFRFRDRDQIVPDRQLDRDPQGPYRERSSRSQRRMEDDQIGPDRQLDRDRQGPYRERSSRSQRRMDDGQMGSDRQARRGPQGAYREGPPAVSDR